MAYLVREIDARPAADVGGDAAMDLPTTELLLATRRHLGMSLSAFTRLVADQGGPLLTRQRLSGYEQGQHLSLGLLHAVAEACATITDLPDELRTRWLCVLRQPGSWDPVPESQLPDWRGQLRMLADRFTNNPKWPLYRKLAGSLGVDLKADVTEARRRMGLPDDPAWQPSPEDDVAVIGRASALSVNVERGKPFVLTCALSNRGTVPWRDRLLIRLGPPVTSSLAYMPPVLSVPDTDPGAECRVVIPGRAPWFPNLSVVGYIMAFPDCQPCLYGSLRLRVDARQQPGPATQLLPRGLAAYFRSKSRKNRPKDQR